jgi:hypothetical protein
LHGKEAAISSHSWNFLAYYNCGGCVTQRR